MPKFVQWFTSERREAIQIFLGSLATLLILGGFLSEHAAEQWLLISGAALQFIANISNLAFLKKGDWGGGWAIVRGAVYALAATVAPALATLGVVVFDSDLLLTILSLVLAGIGNLIAIFTIEHQKYETQKP